MGLEIFLSNHHGRPWYTAGETICGTIVWKNNRPTTISRILVSLEGVLESSIRPVSGQENSFGTSRHTLLDQQQSLYGIDSTCATRCKPFSPGTHKFEFQLSFPGADELPQGCPKCESKLPLSFNFASEGIKASVFYRIRIVVERRGVLKSNLTREQLVEYKPLLPFFCCPNQHEWNITGRTQIRIPGSAGKTITDLDAKPTQSSRVTMEVNLPGPRTLRPGNPVNLSISFLVPPDLRIAFTPMWIFGLSIRLKSRTVVTAGTHVRAHVGYVDVCNIQAIVPVERKPSESQIILPPALWEYCIYPVAIPTFHFCQAERTYQLEVTVNFACSKADGSYKAMTVIDVKLESGAIDASEPPPEYSADP